MDEQTLRMLENTRQLCLQNPHAAQVRKTLMRELRRRADAGLWTGRAANAKLFQVDTCDDAYQVELTWSPTRGFQGILDTALEATGGNTGLSMRYLAEHVEKFSEALRTGKDLLHDVPAEDRERLTQLRMDRAVTECLIRDVAEAGEDLAPGASPGYTLYGYGLAAVAWRASGSRAEELARSRRLWAAADARDCMTVQLVGRDGVLWTAEMDRGGSPIALAWLPEEGRRIGDVVNGLSRLTNATCTSEVPIWPADRPQNQHTS